MRVLIFSSSAGNGHNSTAKRLTEMIVKNDKDAIVETVDVYKSYTSKFKAWIMEDGYFLACNHLLSIYNFFFKLTEKTKFDDKDKSAVNFESYQIMYGMLKKIYDFKPDVIISTYFICAVALSNLRRFYTIPARILCMTLDYGISPYWECCSSGLDYMFLTNEKMIRPFKQRGFRDEQLIVSGIPVAEKFGKNDSKSELREKLGLDQNLFTMIVMKASFFPISNENLVKQFKKINEKIQIVIVNGKDKKNFDDMQKRLDKANLKHNVINLGFTDKIDEYFGASDLVLGKAGGLSSTESINSKLPSLIVDKLPQQEIYNRNFLVENNCALSVNKKTIAENVNGLLNDRSKLERLSAATEKIRKLDALEKFADVIRSSPEADYSGIHFTDNKRQVKSNVNKERLKSVKKSRKLKIAKKKERTKKLKVVRRGLKASKKSK